jgi:hypothetical protein
MSDDKVVSINKARPLATTQLADVSDLLHKLIELLDSKGMNVLVSHVSGWNIGLSRTEADDGEDRCDICYHTRSHHNQLGANASHEFKLIRTE